MTPLERERERDQNRRYSCHPSRRRRLNNGTGGQTSAGRRARRPAGQPRVRPLPAAARCFTTAPLARERRRWTAADWRQQRLTRSLSGSSRAGAARPAVCLRQPRDAVSCARISSSSDRRALFYCRRGRRQSARPSARVRPATSRPRRRPTGDTCRPLRGRRFIATATGGLVPALNGNWPARPARAGPRGSRASPGAPLRARGPAWSGGTRTRALGPPARQARPAAATVC